MKTRQLPKAALLSLPIAFLMLCTLSTKSSAQSIVPATNPDNTIGQFGYPNSASIDYTPNCGGLCSNPQLTALVADQGMGGPQPTLWVYDQVASWTSVTLPVPAGFGPDVIIGNDLTTSSQYIIGVVGVMANDVYLLTYSVSGEGTGTLTITPTGTYNISNSLTVSGASPAHIDIEAQYSTLFLGQPTCNNFAIAWQDNTNGIMGYFASLSSPTSGTPTTISGAASDQQADVALVERLNPATNLYEDWALFGYIQPLMTTHLVYQEWNTAGAPSAAITYDNTHMYLPYGYIASAVRIDAIDNYQLNMPGPSVYPGTPPAPFAFFDMVAAAGTGSPAAEVFEYNNKLGTFSWRNITAPVTALASNLNWLPVVTCGPGQFYSVGYVSRNGSISNQGVYATPIDWSSGAPLPPGNAYAVNNSTWNLSPGPTQGGVSLAATCNTSGSISQKLFAGWENGPQLYDKYTGSVPYTFKHTPTAQQVTTTTNWLLAPNPAIDEVTLTAPTGFSAKDGDSYSITDLSGRELQHGNITDATQEINVNNLSAGMYLLNLNAHSGVKTVKFTKE